MPQRGVKPKQRAWNQIGMTPKKRVCRQLWALGSFGNPEN